jgi:predicted anti-sigma-YlaC factor YlaD
MAYPAHIRVRPIAIVVAASVALLCSLNGCSVRTAAIGALAEALGGDETLVFTGESDLELVAASLPTMLKVYEALIEKAPGDPRLLTGAGRAFALYAFAFVQAPADRLPDEQAEEQKAMHRRARALYQRGRDYALAALETAHPGLTEAVLAGRGDSALAATTQDDTTALYWAGVAWMGQLTVGRPGLPALMHLPRAAALVRRVLELSEAFGEGAAYEALIAYYGLAPRAVGGDTAKAAECFDKAVALSKGAHARPYVAMATTLAGRKADRARFEELLRTALAIGTRERDRNRLVNLVHQDIARWLAAGADRFYGTAGAQ